LAQLLEDTVFWVWACAVAQTSDRKCNNRASVFSVEINGVAVSISFTVYGHRDTFFCYKYNWLGHDVTDYV